MEEARLRALTHAMLTIRVIPNGDRNGRSPFKGIDTRLVKAASINISYRNGRSPFKGIDTLTKTTTSLPTALIEMEEARLRALTPNSEQSSSQCSLHRNGRSPFKGIDTPN